MAANKVKPKKSKIKTLLSYRVNIVEFVIAIAGIAITLGIFWIHISHFLGTLETNIGDIKDNVNDIPNLVENFKDHKFFLETKLEIKIDNMLNYTDDIPQLTEDFRNHKNLCETNLKMIVDIINENRPVVEKNNKELFDGFICLMNEEIITENSLTSIGLKYHLNENICEYNRSSSIFDTNDLIKSGNFLRIKNTNTDLSTWVIVIGTFSNEDDRTRFINIPTKIAKEIGFNKGQGLTMGEFSLISEEEWQNDKEMTRLHNLYFEKTP